MKTVRKNKNNNKKIPVKFGPEFPTVAGNSLPPWLFKKNQISKFLYPNLKTKYYFDLKGHLAFEVNDSDGATGDDCDWQSDGHLSEQDQMSVEGEHSQEVFDDSADTYDALKNSVENFKENLNDKNDGLRKDSVDSDEDIDQIELGELSEVDPPLLYFVCTFDL